MHIDRELAARLGREAVAIQEAGGYTAPSAGKGDMTSALEACTRRTVEYPPDRPPDPPSPGSHHTRITIENDTVLAVGRRMAAGGAVAALNFAAAGSLGGGFSLRRTRTGGVYRAIVRPFTAIKDREMYRHHRALQDAMYTDWLIYSPDVPVFRTDDGELLEEPWALTILTCAAVNGNALGRQAPDRLSEVPAVMTARTARVLTVAAEQNVRRLILGAWGCGAFGLDPHMMARIFHDALHGPFRGVFEEIVFAITDWSEEQQFIGPFKKVLSA